MTTRKNEVTELTKAKRIKQLDALIFDIVPKALEQAGKIIYDWYQEDNDAIGDIIKERPILTTDFLITLLNIGRGRMDARVLLDISPAGRAIRQLPIAEQRRLYDSGVISVLEHGDDGKVERVEKPIINMTTREVKQTFSTRGVRPETQQREIMMTYQVPKEPAPRNKPRYEMDDDGNVRFYDCLVTPAQLETILEMAKNKQKQSLQATMKRGQTRATAASARSYAS